MARKMGTLTFFGGHLFKVKEIHIEMIKTIYYYPKIFVSVKKYELVTIK